MKDNNNVGSKATEIRSHFAANLSHLIAESNKSHAEVCKMLSIHRTQLTRFLASLSFPRPDTLARVCAVFDVDARILLTDIDSYRMLSANALPTDVIGHPQPASSADFPDGFYEEWRPLLPCDLEYACHLLHVSTVRNTRRTRLFYKAARIKPDGDIESLTSVSQIFGVAINQAGGVLMIENQLGAMHYTMTTLKFSSHGSPNYLPGHKKSVSAIVDGRRLMKSATVLKYLGPSLSAALHTRRQPRFRKASDTPEIIRVILDDMEDLYCVG